MKSFESINAGGMVCEADELQTMLRALFLLAERPDVQGKEILWEQVPGMDQELASFSAQTIRSYMNAASAFWFLEGFEDRGDSFVVRGLTRLGKFRQRGKKSATRIPPLEQVLHFILVYLVISGAPASKAATLSLIGWVLKLFSLG